MDLFKCQINHLQQVCIYDQVCDNQPCSHNSKNVFTNRTKFLPPI